MVDARVHICQLLVQCSLHTSLFNNGEKGVPRADTQPARVFSLGNLPFLYFILKFLELLWGFELRVVIINLLSSYHHHCLIWNLHNTVLRYRYCKHILQVRKLRLREAK